MRFRITHFFALTFLFAICLLPLSIPSEWWMLGLPALLSLIAVYCTSKVMLSPSGGRLFWTAFAISLTAYLGGVMFVAYLTSLRDRLMHQTVWDEYLGLPFWKLLHGEDAFIANPRNIANEDFLSFLIFTHFVMAVVISLLSALVAQFIADRRVLGHSASVSEAHSTGVTPLL